MPATFPFPLNNAVTHGELKYGMVPWFQVSYFSPGLASPILGGRIAAGRPILGAPSTAAPSTWLIKDVQVKMVMGEATECTFKIYPRASPYSPGTKDKAGRNIIGDPNFVHHESLQFGTPWRVDMGYHDPALQGYKYTVFTGCLTAKQPHFSQGVNYVEITCHSASYWLQYLNGTPSDEMHLTDEGHLRDMINNKYQGLTEFIPIEIADYGQSPFYGGEDQPEQTTTGGHGQNLLQTLQDFAAKRGYLVFDRHDLIYVGPITSIMYEKGPIYHPDRPEDKGAIFYSFEPEQEVFKLYQRVIVQWVRPFANSLNGSVELIPIRAVAEANELAREQGYAPTGTDLIITNVPVESEQHAYDLAYRTLMGQMIPHMRGALSMPGTYLMTGDTVRMTGAELGPTYEGNYFVEAVTHSWTDSGYSCDADLLKMPDVNFDAMVEARVIHGKLDQMPFDPANRSSNPVSGMGYVMSFSEERAAQGDAFDDFRRGEREAGQ